MKRSLLVACAAVLPLVASSNATAAMIIKDPNPPKYAVEIEPKLNLGFFGFADYGGNSWGPGVRFSIPVMSPGFVKKLNNSVAISFGADFLRYEGYRYYSRWCNRNNQNCYAYYQGDNANFWAVHLPVTLQWNFFLTDKWSVFGEPGITLRRAFYNDPYCAPGTVCSSPYPSPWNVYPTFFAGGRFHFSEKAALTLRLGHPIDLSVGVSFFL